MAVTFWLELRVTLQLPVPVHAPLHPVNDEPDAGAAAKLTVVPALNVEEQEAPQLIPAGTLVIEPLPVPAVFVVNVNTGTNMAVTAVSVLTATVQVPVPAQTAPLQPANAEPVAGDAVKVTCVPELKDEEQVLPHAMPAGLLLTVPEPAPEAVIESVDCIGGGAAKLAATVVSAFNVTLHAPEPEQAPLQPVNAKFCDGAMVSVTTVPETKFALQDAAQLMPAGLLITVPLLAGET